MVRYTPALVFLVGSLIAVSTSLGQEPPAKPQVKVEIRWVERMHVEGLTEAKGFVKGYDPRTDTVYPHKKPALVLTAAEVAEAKLIENDFRGSGSGIHYMVELHLTDKARKQLADSYEGNEMRLLTVVVDGKYWGLHRYEKGKDEGFLPAQVRAETFVPSVGYFSSEAEARRLVDALK